MTFQILMTSLPLVLHKAVKKILWLGSLRCITLTKLLFLLSREFVAKINKSPRELRTVYASICCTHDAVTLRRALWLVDDVNREKLFARLINAIYNFLGICSVRWKIFRGYFIFVCSRHSHGELMQVVGTARLVRAREEKKMFEYSLPVRPSCLSSYCFAVS